MTSSIFRLVRDGAPETAPFGALRWISHPPSAGPRTLTALEAVIVPGQGHPFHVHPEQDEIILVVAGQLEQWVEDEKRLLEPGDAVVIPMGTAHASFNAGGDDLRIIATFAPSIGDVGFTMVDVAGEAPWAGLRRQA